MTEGEKKNVCLFSQVQLLNAMLAMTLLASANNPRLQRYCVLAQSKHCRAVPLLPVTLGRTQGFVPCLGSVCTALCQGSSHTCACCGVDGQTDGQTDGGPLRGEAG